jgi:pilus assembly protein CpaB
VVTSRFVEPSELSRSAVDVPDGLLEVTVSLAPHRAIGGQLTPGSTVAVLASFDPFDVEGVVADPGDEPETEQGRRTANSTHLILHKVLVTNVQHTQGAAGLGGNDDEGGTGAGPAGELLVTMALDAPSVEQVVFTAEHGRLWLSLEPEGAPEDGTRIQTRETIYR